MEKEFAFFDGLALQEVVLLALDQDSGTRTFDHRYFDVTRRLWILREVLLNPSNRFIECFEFTKGPLGSWGLRAWGEEEGIPFFDCPLDLLAKANCAIDLSWREAVTSRQACAYALPIGGWLHSTTGVLLPNGERCHDFRFAGADLFICQNGHEWRLPPDTVAAIAREGCGVAAGRA